MIDPASEGIQGATYEVDVERGKCREFARSVHATHPAFYDGDTPVSVPTFLTTTFHWERGVPDASVWEKVGMSNERGMHAEQEYVFHGPPPKAGTRLFATSRIDRVFTKEGRRGGTLTFAVMITEFRDADGTLVAEAKMTGVETAKPPTEDA